MALPNWTLAQVYGQLNTGYVWSGSTITFSFPTSAAGFSGTEYDGFSPLNSAQTAAALQALQLWDDLIAPSLVNVGPSQFLDPNVDIQIANSNTEIEYAHAYFPSVNPPYGGEVWFSSEYADLQNPTLGSYAYSTFSHEIGHALGLNHMGDYDGAGFSWPNSASSIQDDELYSQMSYFSPHDTGSADWVGADGVAYYSQTPMLNDIYAIQQMYGADTTTRTGNTTYGFNASGGMASVFNFSVNKNPIITIYDAGGVDTIDLSGYATNSVLDLNSGAFSSFNSMTKNLAIYYTTVIENGTTGAGNDVINGNQVGNTLVSGAGNDTVYGNGGNDALWAGAGDAGADQFFGGAGNDKLGGGAGNDTLVGGMGGDQLFGGSGNDWLSAGAASGATTTDSGSITNAAWGGSGSDRVDGDNTNDQLGGGSGNDTIYGHGGNDTFYGGKDASGDTVNHDFIVGGAGNDLVFAGTGNDTVSGEGGNDTLWGGLGNDQLSGGDGSDLFGFAASSGADSITDYQLGIDILDISQTATNFASVADVIAAAVDTAAGLQIALGGGATVTLAGLDVADIDAMDFVF